KEHEARQEGIAADVAVDDVSDVDLGHESPAGAEDEVAGGAAGLVSRGAVAFMLGGEHLLTLGAVRGLAEVYPDLAVIQLDAHADLREDWMGEPLSHATVIRRVSETGGAASLFPLGIRPGTAEETAWARPPTRWPPHG